MLGQSIVAIVESACAKHWATDAEGKEPPRSPASPPLLRKMDWPTVPDAVPSATTVGRSMRRRRLRAFTSTVHMLRPCCHACHILLREVEWAWHRGSLEATAHGCAESSISQWSCRRTDSTVPFGVSSARPRCSSDKGPHVSEALRGQRFVFLNYGHDLRHFMVASWKRKQYKRRHHIKSPPLLCLSGLCSVKRPNKSPGCGAQRCVLFGG